ncbi:Cytochrome P450 [Amanita muscaria]
MPPGSQPIVGHSLTILGVKNSGTTLREWIKQFGPTLRVVGPFWSDHLIMMKPEHLEKVLGKDSAHEYPKPGFVRRALEIMFGYGLVTVIGDEHRSLRKAMNPAFSMANLTAQTSFYYEAIDGLAGIFNDQIVSSPDPSKGKVIQTYDWISKATLDIICQAGFGYRADSLHNPHDELAVSYHNLISSQSGPNLAKLLYLMFIPGMLKLMRSSWLYERRHWLDIIPFTGYFRVLHESMHRITKISEKLLEQKIIESISLPEGEGKRDIMSILVRSRKVALEKDSKAYTISDAIMVDQVLTFVGAGHAASAITLTAVLWFLANDQKAQSRLREEVTPIMEGNAHADYGALKGLQWLDCILMESLRLFPAVPLEAGMANKTDYVGDILVPKGTVIYIPIAVVNTDKGTWGEDAEEWKPSRWLDLPKEFNLTYSFLSFYAGSTACIGKTMAFMELKMTIARLITNFTFEPAYDGQVLNLETGISTIFVDGMPLCIKRVN